MWSLTDVAVGVGAMAIMLGGRRISGLFPGALVAVVAGSLWSWATDYDGSVVGDIEVELVVRTDLPWGDLPVLLLPALVIAIVGFAEPSAIARRYAAEDRTYWDSNREFVGRGRRTSPPSGRWLPGGRLVLADRSQPDGRCPHPVERRLHRPRRRGTPARGFSCWRRCPRRCWPGWSSPLST